MDPQAGFSHWVVAQRCLHDQAVLGQRAVLPSQDLIRLDMALPFLTLADTGSWVTFPGPPVPPGVEQLLETRVWCRA